MKTLAYETPKGTLKAVRGEWIEETLWSDSKVEPTFKTEAGMRIMLVGNSRLEVLVTTPKGGKTTRLLGFVA